MMPTRRRLLLVALTLAAAACGASDDMLGVNEGRVRFVLSSGDASLGVVDGPSSVAARTESGPNGEIPADPSRGDGPHFGVASANVTFASILARNLDGVLVNVEMDPPLPVTVDVMALEGGGREIQLPEGSLPAASYDQLVVVMTAVELVTHDGTSITIDPAGGGWTAIVAVCPFTVDAEATTVALKFMVRKSFFWSGSRFHFQPRLVCEQGEQDE
jgi:hypothetical protein